jgi:uncharacterized protein (TIGR02996 family)
VGAPSRSTFSAPPSNACRDAEKRSAPIDPTRHGHRSEDEGFLRDLVANPDDAELRLIYADWLDERGDLRGRFLRLEGALLALPARDARRFELLDRLRRLRRRIDAGWLALLDRTPIENCPTTRPLSRSQAICPGRWEALTPTTDAAVRSCSACAQGVYHCGTIEEAQEQVEAGHPVAVDSRLERRGGDLRPNRRFPAAPSPRASGFRRGQTVLILRGRFAGEEGVIEQIHQTWLLVRVLLPGGRRTDLVRLDDVE